jgi:peptidylprolyl isomerase
MAQARIGDTVKVHYEGRLDDGTLFASSAERGPAEVTIGSHILIPAFEEAIIGMEPTESKTFKVATDDAFGPHRDDLVQTIGRQPIEAEKEPKVGDRLNAIDPGGKSVTVVITDVSEQTITIDANHPLAGEELTFQILLVEIG